MMMIWLSLFAFFQEYFHSRVFEEGVLAKQEVVEAINMPEGASVVIAIPFLDVNPIAASESVL